MSIRIHTVGASGSGTTTLAKAIAQKLGCPHFDSDDYYWEKTDPPFATKRSIEERLELLQKNLSRQASWALSGSLVSWGDPIIPHFSHVVFLYIPPQTRLKRLKLREQLRYGDRIESGGDMEKIHADLMEWAAKYDQGGLEVRSKKVHEEWFKKLKCPLFRIEEDLPTEKQVELVLSSISSIRI